MKRPAAIIFNCDLAVPPVELPHCPEHTVGSHHALMALRTDWQKPLEKIHDELDFARCSFTGSLMTVLESVSVRRTTSSILFLIRMEERRRKERVSASGLPLYYTEWNSSSNPRDPMHDDSYSAACAIETSIEASRGVQVHSSQSGRRNFRHRDFHTAGSPIGGRDGGRASRGA